ncbi:fibronectin type III domain-containing protein [Actinoplanes sp. N902-109]|nr:fibronectin type III domain-containing protein [Actinoplanes sp. N902-109]
MTEIAGNRSGGPAAPGPALESPVSLPYGIGAGANGDLYVALLDYNQVVRLTRAGPADEPPVIDDPEPWPWPEDPGPLPEDPGPLPAGTPGTPGVPSVSLRSGTATVSWTAPAGAGGADITSYEVQAYVHGQPVEGGACSVEKPASAEDLHCDVAGLVFGVPYTFTVAALNENGGGDPSAASAEVTPVDRPDAPAVSSTLPGAGRVTVGWAAPKDNGSAITGYEVRAYLDGQPVDGATCTSGTALGCAVTGLTNGTAYTFRVTATNEAGTSDASAPSKAATPVDRPAAPVVTDVRAGNGVVTVAWAEPVDNGSAITGYEVQAYLDGQPIEGATCTPEESLQCPVTGLTNGTTYTFTVTATNGQGQSELSGTVSAVPVGKPGAPVVTGVLAAPRQVTVSWNPPATDGGPVITSYKVQAYQDGQPVEGATCTPQVRSGISLTEFRVAASEVLTCTVTGLTNGTAYTFQVTATNAVGTGDASAPSAAAIPVDRPEAPVVTDVLPGDGKVTVRWSAPGDNGSAVVGYRVQAYRDGEPVKGRECITEGLLECAIAGLLNGTEYQFTVTAANGIGPGEPSGAVPGIPAGPPVAPVVTGVTTAAGQATVTWEAPVSNGGLTVIGYRVRAYHDGVPVKGVGCTSGQALRCTVTGLANGTAYTFTVAATNKAGTGPESLPSEPATPVAPVPPAPSTPSAPGAPGTPVVTAGVSSIVVSWPAASGDVTGYTAAVSPGRAPAPRRRPRTAAV